MSELREHVLHQLEHLEEVAKHIGIDSQRLSSACAAVEAGELEHCQVIIDLAIPFYNEHEVGQISGPLVGIHNQLNNITHHFPRVA